MPKTKMLKGAVNFNFLKDDTKLFKYQDWVYKVKVLYEEKNDIVPKFTKEDANDDLDNILRAVLHILEKKIELKKIETKHFYVIVKTKPWKAAQNIGFKRNGIAVKSYPNMIILRLKVKPSVVSQRTELKSQIGETLSTSSVDSSELDQLKQNALHSNVRVVLNKLPVNTKLSKNQNDNENSVLLESKDQSTNSKKHQSKKHAKVLSCHESEEVQSMCSYPLKLMRERKADVDEIPKQRETRKRKITPDLTDNAQNVSRSKVLCKQRICETEMVKRQSSRNIPSSTLIRRKAIKKRNVPVIVHENKNVNAGNQEISLPSFTVRDYDVAEGQRLQSLQKRTNVLESTQATYPMEDRSLNQLSEPDISSQPWKMRQKDRHVIEKEELDEDMKLQQLAKSSPNIKNDQEKRPSSGVWNIVETILTPVKKIFS